MANTGQAMTHDMYLALRRVHVATPDWANQIGTDYWLTPGKDYLSASKSTTLSDRGWTTTTQVITLGSAESFGVHVASTGVPSAFIPTAASSSLVSPAIFGDYNHMWNAAQLLRKKQLPLYMIADIYGAFPVNVNASESAGFGFLKGGGTNGTQSANEYGYINSDGTNFQLYNSTTNSANTLAVDTLYHRWRIVFDRLASKIYFTVDGNVPTGFVAPTITAGTFPMSFAAWNSANNTQKIASAHIFYDYAIPQFTLMGQAVV